MNILIIIGHPRKQSLTSAIAESFYNGAVEAGTDAKLLYLCDLDFNPNVIHPTPHLQEDEPDITYARNLFTWADHIVFVYPTWWGTMPALMKGFIDRVFISGFAFNETEGGTGYEPLLVGKTAQMITTMDTPKFVYHVFYKSPGHHALGTATLKFSGFKVKKPIRFGMVRYSNEEKRKQWIDKAYQQGLKLKNGVISPLGSFLSKTLEWVKAIRLQFYPMTFIAYTVGALGAKLAGYGLNNNLFWLGYAWIFFAEVLTVFCNEYFDQHSDRNNHYYGPFNGGSRVLVTNGISNTEMRGGIIVSAFLAIGLMTALVIQSGLSQSSVVVSSVVLLVIATGYTVPPLRLSYRGLGELTVGITHSFAVILCGFLYQGGNFSASFPWLTGLPLFLSVLPSIILAGIPDSEADKKAGKNTIAVLLGGRRAAGLAIFFTIAAALTVTAFALLNLLPSVFKNILFGVLPHAALLTWMLTRYFYNYKSPGRIDGLIVVALTYLMWFALVPLLNLL
jgi:putative NADPH-quinone reductase/1,4-dihydroxy-2-naphthoate octaprenyltransferase